MLCEFMNNDDDEQLGAHIVQCFDDDIRPVVIAAAAVASGCKPQAGVPSLPCLRDYVALCKVSSANCTNVFT